VMGNDDLNSAYFFKIREKFNGIYSCVKSLHRRSSLGDHVLTRPAA